MIGIYKITSPTGRIYIGQSVDIESRFKSYYYLSCKTQRVLYNSLKKHGVENHLFEVIEECAICELNIKERYWQDYYSVLGNNGMNLKLTRTHDKSGRVSDETKSIISFKSKEWYSKNEHPLLGKKPKEETLRKQSEKRKGLLSGAKNPNFGKKGILNHNYGKKRCKNFIEKIKGGNNPMAKLVFNTQTGIFYETITLAAHSINWKRERLKNHINFRNGRNNTDFIYA